MRNDSFVVEFSDLYIELSKQALHKFIKKMMGQDYTLFWRYDTNNIYLIVELDDSVYELPFIRNREFLTLTAKSLHVRDSVLANALEKLVQNEKGSGIVKRTTKGPLYITSYLAGDIESMIEIDGSEKIMMNRNGSLIQYKDNDKALAPRTIYNMTNLEIDYVLMELHEAIMAKDEERIDAHKRKLKQLVSKRKQVEKLLK